VIELLPGYLASNWTQLQTELKNIYWPHDTQRDTPVVLNQLIKDAPGMDLNVFVLKYTAITVTLVTKDALSALDRVGRFLDGLSPDLRKKALKFCAKRNWRLSTHDTGTTEPNFGELREFILTEAKAAQKETVYIGERALREGTLPSSPTITVTKDISDSPLPPLTTVEAAAMVKSVPAPSTDAIAELTQQFSKLALLIEATMQKETPVPKHNTIPASSSMPSTSSAPTRRYDNARSGPAPCHWCDNSEHQRFQCTEFAEVLSKGLVRVNEQNRVVNTVTGQELPLMSRRGGWKVLFAAGTVQPKPPVTAAMTSVITVEELPSASLDPENSVHLVTIRDDGSEIHEIIDADVDVKRRRDDLVDSNRRVRPRTDDIPFVPSQPTQPSPNSAHFAPIPPVPVPNSVPRFPEAPHSEPPHQQDTPMRDDTPRERRYRLDSELRESISIAEIGEKIMQMPISLSFGEILAASPDLAAHFSDQARKRRRPIAPISPDSTGTTSTGEPIPPPTRASISTQININVGTVNSIIQRPFYACPSGRAKAIVDDVVRVSTLLDNDSEVCLMPQRMADRLDLPIDIDVKWRIDGFRKMEHSEVDRNSIVGLIHEIRVNIGGIIAVIPCFVVDDCNADLILGRPWEKAVRAQYINEDDGSYTCIIRSHDSRRIVRFYAAKADDERNRLYARHPEAGIIDVDSGKL
jgi:hypothetical protein